MNVGKDWSGMLELNKIYNMDCLEGMKLLDDECIDLTVTSPPYDNLRTYNGFSFDFEGIAKELYRVTKQGGVVVWVVGDQTTNGSESGTSFRQALYFKEIGFNLHDTMIFEKDSLAFPDTNRYFQSFEYMFVFSKGKPKTTNLIADIKNKWNGTNIKGRYRDVDGELKQKSGSAKGNKVNEFSIRRNIWKIGIGFNKSTSDLIAFNHPAIFPESLVQDHVITWSKDKDLILDPFMGSGTTAKIALLTNRYFVGFEINKEYCDIAEKRIDYLLRQTTIFTDFEVEK